MGQSTPFAESQKIVGNYEPGKGPGPRILSADSFEGEDVVDRNGDKVGEISEIMIDVPSGRIAYAVLSVGGILGMGDRLHAIPWSALTLDAENKCFIINAEAGRLKDAPGFDKDHWPSMADETWARSLHEYYGVPTYWG